MVRIVAGWQELYPPCEAWDGVSLSLAISPLAKVSFSAPCQSGKAHGEMRPEKQPSSLMWVCLPPCPLVSLPVSARYQSDLFLQPMPLSLPLLPCSTQTLAFFHFPERHLTICAPIPVSAPAFHSFSIPKPPNFRASLPCLP